MALAACAALLEFAVFTLFAVVGVPLIATPTPTTALKGTPADADNTLSHLSMSRLTKLIFAPTPATGSGTDSPDSRPTPIPPRNTRGTSVLTSRIKVADTKVPTLRLSRSCSFCPGASDSRSKVFSKRIGSSASAVLFKGAGKLSAMPCKLLATETSAKPRLKPSVAV